ncbi:MAG: hypothetical protein KGN34_03480 [Sphingomonadales bacterium]|nr:hypothetical protein [Sphingomonadales bacterium]
MTQKSLKNPKQTPGGKTWSSLPCYRTLGKEWLVDADPVAIESIKLGSIRSLIWYVDGVDKRITDAKVALAYDMIEDLNPSDAAEVMLIRQMVANYFASNDCLELGNFSNTPSFIREKSLDRAQRHMNLYVKQMNLLSNYRNKKLSIPKNGSGNG